MHHPMIILTFQKTHPFFHELFNSKLIKMQNIPLNFERKIIQKFDYKIQISLIST